MPDRAQTSDTFENLRGLIFDMLLVTDGRTTELLETILQEKLGVSVIRQERAEGAKDGDAGEDAFATYVRESVLVGERSRLPVSHNVALVDSRYVPPALFQAIAGKQLGIGKAIGAEGIRAYRKVLDSGTVDFTGAADLFGQPLALKFPVTKDKVPYKKYAIHFEERPGILLLEYYDPRLVKYRLTNGKDAGRQDQGK